MGYASCFEDNEEAVAEARALDRKAGHRAAARLAVDLIGRSTPAGSRNGGSEPQLAKAGAAANRGRACRAALEVLRGRINGQRNR